MIKRKLQSYNMNNKGSAIITGLVVSAILMVLCLSLLLVSYSLVLSTANNNSNLANKELLYSAVESIECELTDITVDITQITTENGDIFVNDDALETILTPRELWKYVYINIWKGFEFEADGVTVKKDKNNYYIQNKKINNKEPWYYYDPEQNNNNHTKVEKYSKYFLMTSIGNVKLVVQFYWQLPKSWDGRLDNINGTSLCAIYTLYSNKAEELVKAERKYILSYGDKYSPNLLFVKDEEAYENLPQVNEMYQLNDNYSNDKISVIFCVTEAKYNTIDNKSSYKGTLTITNDSDQNYDNWKIIISSDDQMEFESDYIDPVNAYRGKYIITGNNLNRNLTPEYSVPIEFLSEGYEFKKLPEIEIIKPHKELLGDQIVSITSEYNEEIGDDSCFEYIITVNNITEIPIKDWNICFTCDDDTITTDTYLLEQEDAHYTLKDDGYLQDILKDTPLQIIIKCQSGSTQFSTIQIFGVYEDDTKYFDNGIYWKWNRMFY